MSAHDNITLARHYVEDNLKRIRPMRSSEMVESDGTTTLAALQSVGASLPNLHFTIHAVVAHGDEVEVFATSEASIPAPDSAQPCQRVRVSERHMLRIVDGQVVAHQVDHAARVDVWDTHQGWRPFTRSASPPQQALH